LAFSPGKISKSAPIRVYAPAEISINEVTQKVKFEPAISGHWLNSKTGFLNFINIAYGKTRTTDYEYAEYQPDQPLTEGLHYQQL